MSADILFINPGNHKKNYQDLSKEYTAISTPVWTLLLSNYARKSGYDVAVYDVNVEGWDEDTACEVIRAHNPVLVIIMVYGHNPSASTQTMPAAGRIARDIKAYNGDLSIAMGGIHPSALPERTLNEEAIDFVIQGEGPYTIKELMGVIKGKGKLSGVRGLWHRKNGAVISNEPAPVVQNLDEELDDYAWDLLPGLENYRAHNMHCFQDFGKSTVNDFSDIRSPYVAMNTSLGCPYSCHYCCINAIFGKPGIRYWSLEKVCSWFDIIAGKYGVRNIRFDDELFILSPKRVERFCDMVIERGYDLNIWVYGRVDTIQKQLLRKLKSAGVNWICLGIESGNENVRKDVNKSIRRDIKDVVRMIQDHGIYVLGNYMLGLPEDTLETMGETMQLAADLNCEYMNVYTVMALPGSQLFDGASKIEGHLPKTWEVFSQLGYETQPLPTRYLSAAEVLKFRDEAFVKYNRSPVYLDMIERKFGTRVRNNIERMLDIKLRRRILEI